MSCGSRSDSPLGGRRGRGVGPCSQSVGIGLSEGCERGFPTTGPLRGVGEVVRFLYMWEGREAQSFAGGRED